jgi:hypothetical protein
MKHHPAASTANMKDFAIKASREMHFGHFSATGLSRNSGCHT